MTITKAKWIKPFLAVFLILLTISLSAYVFLQYKIDEIKNTLTGCQLKSNDFRTTIPFDYVGNWIVVKVSIDGSGKMYDFIFDTGAQTVFSDYFIGELNKGSYEIIPINTDTSRHAFRDNLILLNNFQIGNVKFSNIGAIVVDNGKYEMLNCISPWGIIGYNVIQTCCFQIDYKKKQITLTDNPEKLDNFKEIQWISYKEFTQETPVVPFLINEKILVDLLFDTGFNGGISVSSPDIYDTIRKSYPGQIANYKKRPAIKISNNKKDNPYEGFWYTAKSVRFEENIIKNMVIDVNNNSENEFQGLLGNQFLQDYIITLNYAEKKVGFIKNRLPETKNNSKSFGLGFIPERNRLLVKSVYKNSEPDKVGILVGDEVYSINGVNISDLPNDVFCKIYRNEFNLLDSNMMTLRIEIIRDGKISSFKFRKQNIFK